MIYVVFMIFLPIQEEYLMIRTTKSINIYTIFSILLIQFIFYILHHMFNLIYYFIATKFLEYYFNVKAKLKINN